MIWAEDTCFCGARSVSQVNVVHVGNVQPSAREVGQDTRCCHGKSFLQRLGSWAGWVLRGAFHNIALGRFPGAVSWDKHSAAEMEGYVNPALSKPRRGIGIVGTMTRPLSPLASEIREQWCIHLWFPHLPLHCLLWVDIAPSISFLIIKS